MIRRSVEGAASFSQAKTVVSREQFGESTIGNPCIVQDMATGTLWLAFCRDNLDVLPTRSEDDGVTWSKPIDITASAKRPGWGWYATGPGMGIQIQGGAHRDRLVVPCDHRFSQPASREANDLQNWDWRLSRDNLSSHMLYSDDHGTTWTFGEDVALGSNECQVSELSDGRVMVNTRMQAHRHGWRGVALSDDGGTTWPVSKLLHPGPAGYSCLATLPDGDILCLYEAWETRMRERITLASFSLDWLTSG